MTDVETLREWRDKLIDNRASGVREARFGDESVSYKSDEEMAMAIRDLERRIANAARPKVVRTVYVNPSRGT